MKRRVVHYRSHNATATFFDCYYAESKAWQQGVKTAHEIHGTYLPGRFKVNPPLPLRTTSLEKITCRECWRSIAAMARKALVDGAE